MWNDFIGNQPVVARLRELVAGGTAARTLVLAGPEGMGKERLAFLFGLALNCQAPPQPGDICGVCASCARAVPLDRIPAQTEAALEHRAAEVKTNPREVAPLRVSLHPSIWLYPPDGDFFSLPQARSAIHQSQLHPDRGATWTLILSGLDQARWTTQAALLKTLEEPPPRAALVVLARNPLALLPTVRSRALILSLEEVAAPVLEAALVARGLEPQTAALASRLAQGRPGAALKLDLAAYRQARAQALGLLQAGLHRSPEADTVFRLSESFRANKEKFETMIEILYSVLQDIIYLQSSFPEAVRNVDCIAEITQLAQRLTPQRVTDAVEGLDRIQSAARRNAFRPLALANWGLGLGGSAASRL